MKLRYAGASRYIVDENNIVFARVLFDEPGRDPALGAKLAAGPEAVMLLERVLAVWDEGTRGTTAFPAADIRALLACVSA